MYQKRRNMGKYADLADRYFLHFVQRCSGFRDPGMEDYMEPFSMETRYGW